MDLVIEYGLPDPALYCQLRAEAGWDVPDRERAAHALRKSLFGVLAHNGGETIGMARIIGDGTMNVYIQDVIVGRSHRGRGVGTGVMKAIMSRLKTEYPPEITVGLMASRGNEPLYERFGFVARPSGPLGAGMMAALSELKSDA
ncbi:MAG: GNAT family N-acetyltransferase [Pseudomonadota bacterium]